METTANGDLWRREGGHILLIPEPRNGGDMDVNLTMDDLETMMNMLRDQEAPTRRCADRPEDCNCQVCRHITEMRSR